MNLRLMATALFCLVGCQGSDEQATGSPVLLEWIEASESLDSYRKRYAGRPVLAVFGAEWDTNGILFRKLLAAESTARSLSDKGYVFLYYDCTNSPGDGAGWAEAERLGRGLYEISFAAVCPENGNAEKIQSLRVAPEEIDSFIANLVETRPNKMLDHNP